MNQKKSWPVPHMPVWMHQADTRPVGVEPNPTGNFGAISIECFFGLVFGGKLLLNNKAYQHQRYQLSIVTQTITNPKYISSDHYVA